MKYHVIATIDEKKFFSEVVEADDAEQAGKFVESYLSILYVGEVNIIRTVEETRWQKMLKSVLS